MIVKVTCVLLLFFAWTRAEDFDSADLKSEIEAAQVKVKTISEKSVSEVEEVKAKLIETEEYFKNTYPTYLSSAENIINETRSTLSQTTNKFFGDAIDRNKPVSTFKCLLKIAEETETTILDNRKTTQNCFNATFVRITNELSSLRKQLQFIQTATLGLYDVIYYNLAKCKNSGEVTQLIFRAEMRQNNLRKLIRDYADRSSDLRIQYNEGQLNCLETSNKFCSNTMKICENKMKSC